MKLTMRRESWRKKMSDYLAESDTIIMGDYALEVFPGYSRLFWMTHEWDPTRADSSSVGAIVQTSPYGD